MSSELTAEKCTAYIRACIIITFILGVITGYLYHGGENNAMFVPLIIGFVSISFAYYFIEKRGDLIAGRKVEEE